MATAATGWACTHSVSIVSQNNTSATIRVTCYWKNQGWRYSMNYVSAWVYCNGSEYQVKSSGWIDTTSDNQGSYSMGYHDFTISKGTSTQNIYCYAKITSSSSYASGTRSSSSTSVSIGTKPSYTVSYNANGGSGAPGNQTKWYGTNLTLSSIKPSRTGYSFVRWNTNTSNTGTAYNPGATYSGNAGLTLYAIWQANTYTVSYNANGGSGAPGNQTKTYGSNLTLSSTKPIRANYNFLGWSTSANGGVVYASGATYTNNSAITLYAVWELAYTKPRISNFSVTRCTSDGTNDESGTYLKYAFDWSTDEAVSAVKIEYKTQAANIWTSSSVTASGTNGSVNQIIGAGEIDVDSSYYARVYVSDNNGTTYSPQLSIGTANFPIDIKNRGKGVAIGKAAEIDDIFDVAFKTRLIGGIEYISLDPGTDLNNITKTGWYLLNSAQTSNYVNCPLTSGTSTLVVESAGPEGQLHQVIESCDKTAPIKYERFFYEKSWGDWICIMYYGGKLLWGSTTAVSGYYMLSDQILSVNSEYDNRKLLGRISEQPNGIVLVFSYYNSQAYDTSFHSFFISKKEIAIKNNYSHDFLMTTSDFSSITCKRLFISDDAIAGHDDNNKSGTKNGITFNNKYYVLRYVIGV